MFDASNRKDVRAAEKVAKLAEKQRGEIVSQLMSGTPGRAYVYDRLASAHLFHTSFSTDPIQMAFNEGERNQGLQLLNDIMRYCPEQYILMSREANDRHTAAERSRDSNTDRGDQGPIIDGEDGAGGRAEGGDEAVH